MATRLYEGPPLHVAVRSFWRTLKYALFDTYRPELHYMRGPGPKWHAKHRGQPQASALLSHVDAAI
jgi:hypothetical protein